MRLLAISLVALSWSCSSADDGVSADELGACKKHLNIHLAAFHAFPLSSSDSVPAGCWTVESRTHGTRCDWDPSSAHGVSIVTSKGASVSYNETNPSNSSSHGNDGTAIAACASAANAPVEVYMSWTGSGWYAPAPSHTKRYFAELYGHQVGGLVDDAYDQWVPLKKKFDPMLMIRPSDDYAEVYGNTTKLCHALPSGGWLGLYNEANVTASQEKAIVDALNHCTRGINPNPPAAPPAPNGCDVIDPHEGLGKGKSFSSCNGNVRLVLQGDGNLVLYGGPKSLWSTHTTLGQNMVVRGDGNVVLVDSWGVPIWSSKTSGHTNAALHIQDDGNLVLYSTGNTALWATHTHI